MKKLLGIVVLGLLFCFQGYTEVPKITVDALECSYKKNKKRIHNRFIFFSKDQETAEMKWYGANQTEVDIQKLSVDTRLEEIFLTNKYYRIGIDRKNGNFKFYFIGSEPRDGGSCVEFKNDIDIETAWDKMIEEIIKEKKDAIKF